MQDNIISQQEWDDYLSRWQDMLDEAGWGMGGLFGGKRKPNELQPRLKFRNEWKYLISNWEAMYLRQRLEPFMSHDMHADNGMYMIRSLYFDDMWDSSYNEKLMGVEDRCKWRIRCYNCSDRSIKLERKLKRGAYIHKDSATITRQETDALIAGDGEFLLHHKAPLCREFYYEWRTRMYRPKVIVDYDREPLVLQEGDVRITFDSNVRAAIGSYDIFDPTLPTLETLPPDELVLEVKFTEFLPELIHKLLPLGGQEFTAVSKYTLCYERAYHMTDVLAGVAKTNRRKRV